MSRVYISVIILVFVLFANVHNINSQQKSEVKQNASMYNLPRNAVYNENILSFSYERLFPLKDNFGLMLKGGFMIWDPLLPVVETAGVFGSHKNFFEAGIGAMIDDLSNDKEEGFDFLTIRTGYRYQAPKGFLFKASAIYSPDNFILPWIAFGYSF
ncbi:hypothetical protein E9993_18975 [Labilibacter sediminis]|nr:hypothetical protein E9993_18975 [Labilibacter sediminis]